MVIGKGCVEWALPLLNDERMLVQTWKLHSEINLHFQREGKDVNFSDLTITGWHREGTGIRLKEAMGRASGGFEVYLSDWGKLPTCGDKVGGMHQLCPCF